MKIGKVQFLHFAESDMRALVVGFILIAAAFIAYAATPASNAAQRVTAVPNLDLKRYAGTWYEQANFPMYFQAKCVGGNTEANYSLNTDGTVKVVNRCEVAGGATDSAEAVAKTVDGSTSKLKVRFAPAILSFLPFVWGDYWVIGLDKDYRWAVVGTPDRKYLWFLTRAKKADPATFEQMSAAARSQGYNLSKLVRTKQD
jgi:apolipoprotein D and lipocalin family protein